MTEIQKSILRGDILKTLYYNGAFEEKTQMGSFGLYASLDAAGHHDGTGAPLSREAVEGFVDELKGKGFLEKIDPGPAGRMLTDYEVYLTRKGRGLLEGAISKDPDILTGAL